ncbi:Aminopyrimidine aminohydrolase TenA (thiamine salvage pathway) (TenA) (PDB:2QCX) (PUBMED:17618314) [Commensalibacter communis]|uniref:thiaminase II n=1 Tax=Commensalibacter communis TaxID=2972786 RepID=UPI0022FF862E|nr:thiaminase II [Commensalibacter communis]CAI3927632.1 Aminopyrimidine aminohydrolase TenA (thiamine salvage pathway) (TenA) (PDB:2QCX) (PUBMED:17618314) [Commensalibacter communis]CAI3931690.1 Aminopyrimidine aminohydrolase TenA (thiamine salvage pathway) (TenA) (PDB:2QCX) (PUBMED:17618314) [Commensalibacter communis]
MSNVIKSTRSLLDQGLIGRLRRDCQADWTQFTNHRFIKELALGTLPKNEFQQYLLQDYLYLLDFCRVEALAVYKSRSFEEMQYFSSVLHDLLHVELPLHISYCREWGIQQEIIDNTPKTLELLAYSQYILSKAMQGDLLDLIVLLMPCVIGYGEIGLNIISDSESKTQNNPYQSWIDMYSGKEYLKIIQKTVAFLEKICTKYGVEQRYSNLLEQFQTSVRLETAFWDVGRANPL